MTCINCGTEVSSKFCPTCGQSTRVKRISLKEGWIDFWSRVYGFDGMIPRTLVDLTIRPGLVAREYIRGVRVRHYGPVGYFFLMITVYLLLISMLDINFNDVIGKASFVAQPESGKKISQLVMGFVAENLKLIAFIIVPFQGLAARYFVFRKSGLNWMENTVLPFYVMGHVYWFSIIGLVIFKLTGSWKFNSLLLFIILPYYGFAYTTFIEFQSRIKTFFKGIAVYLVGQIIVIVVASVLVGLGFYILSIVSPELYQQLKPSNNP